MDANDRNRQTERAIKAAIDRFMEKSAVDTVSVHSAEDHTGEPALFVTVRLKAGHRRPSGAKSIDLLKALRDALQDVDDDRFPYVTFSAPGDELAEPNELKSA